MSNLGMTGLARQVKKAAIAAAVFAIGLTSACTSVESVRSSSEPGFVHRFAAPYQKVLDAMPAALEAANLQVAESTDMPSGQRVIIARHPASWSRLGYYVRISIKELNVHQTEVEVLSKEGQLASMPGSIGNSSDLFLEIGKRVYGT